MKRNLTNLPADVVEIVERSGTDDLPQAETPSVDAFLAAINTLCIHHNMVPTFNPEWSTFVIVPFNNPDMAEFMKAQADWLLAPKQEQDRLLL